MLTKTKWVIDSAKSVIDFEVKHLIISNVKGTFKKFNATVYTSGNDFLTAEIYFRMTTSSIDTGNIYIDEHLRSADFFDTDNHNEMTFKGYINGKTVPENNYELLGELTIKGITKTINLKVDFEGINRNLLGTENANFTIKGIINRNDWGLNWNTVLEAGKITVSNEVQICCEIQLKKANKQAVVVPLEIIDGTGNTAKFI